MANEIIPDSKRPVLDKIMSGEIPLAVCAGWDDAGKPIMTWVQVECCLCGSKLAMDAHNQEMVKRVNAVPGCGKCWLMIESISGGGRLYLSIIGGKIMSVGEGEKAVDAINRRN